MLYESGLNANYLMKIFSNRINQCIFAFELVILHNYFEDF